MRIMLGGILVSLGLAGYFLNSQPPAATWTLTKESESLVPDAKLRTQIFRALDAAEHAGTNPTISHFQVRAATVVEKDDQEHVVLGGNTEYEVPEAIHGESSLLNHVTALYGAEITKRAVRFVAFFTQTCGTSGSCGDCRDYQIASTDYEHLLIACGQASDHTVRVRRFMDQVVCEKDFKEVEAAKLPLTPDQLSGLVKMARDARRGGVTLFTTERHTGAAGLSYSGKVYRIAAADDAAFHYRYPIGGLLQEAFTDRDYFMRAIVLAGEPGKWPVVNYRDRQYGFEASSFNHLAGKQAIVLILTDSQGKYRMTTFEEALPQPFSIAAFQPQAIANFLKSHQQGAR
jgi:cytidine deaminase